MRRRVNPNKVKLDRTYTTQELAELFDLSEITIRNWQKKGLRVLKEQSPFLMLGQDIRAFITEQRRMQRKKLAVGEFFCLACKKVGKPAGLSAEYSHNNSKTGRLVGRCGHCQRQVQLIVGNSKLTELNEILEIKFKGGA